MLARTLLFTVVSYSYNYCTSSMTPRMEESKWYQLLIFSVEYSTVLEDPIPDEDQMNFDPDNPHLWGTSVPAVCALMTSKSEALYKLVFSKIKEVLEFSPATIMSDFERGVQNALKTTWSESLGNGCRYKLLICYYFVPVSKLSKFLIVCYQLMISFKSLSLGFILKMQSPSN